MSTLKIYKDKEYATLPEFQTQGSACFDVQAAFEIGQMIRAYNPWNKEINIVTKIIAGNTGFLLHPEHRALVPTGLIFDIPEDHVLKMYVRSSVALKKGLVLANGTGIIDSDYVDPSYIILHNISDSLVRIEHGERLAQCALEPVFKYDIEEIDEAPSQKTDRDGGLGSTGT
jgi:dUTP pyrophosphatase